LCPETARIGEGPPRASRLLHFPQRECKDLLIGGSAHPDLTHVLAVMSRLRRRAAASREHRDPKPSAWRPVRPRHFPSRCPQDSQRRMPGLSDVFRSQLGIVPEKVVPVWADRHASTTGGPSTSYQDARLPIHVFGFHVIRSKSCIASILIHFGARCCRGLDSCRQTRFPDVIHSARQSAAWD